MADERDSGFQQPLRDQKVSQRYRELGGEEPSRELDQNILAAARRAADRPHAPLVTPAGRHRWYFGLAAAAVLVLAVGIALHVDRPAPDPEAVSAPAAPAPAPQAAQRAAKPEQPRPAPPPRQEIALEEAKAAAERARAQSEPTREQRAADVSIPAASRAAVARTPEGELERIAELRRLGRHEEADKALAEFRRRYPDYRIAPAMLERLEKR